MSKKKEQNQESKQTESSDSTEKTESSRSKAELLVELLSTFRNGVDYGTPRGFSKPSLYKPGAEKVCMVMNVDAQFEKDDEVLSMIGGTVPGLISFKCTLVDRETCKRIGEGRGSAVLGSKPACRDVNGTSKMAKKSAMIDATLTAFALSERFTQDLEDIPGVVVEVPQNTRVNLSLGGVREESI